MFRSMTSAVSTVSGFVAQGHQTMHHGSCSPSKIPYGGFSPVRLQTGIQPQSSLTGIRVKREARMRRIHATLSVAIVTLSGSCSPRFPRSIYTSCTVPSSCDFPVQRPLARLRVIVSRWVFAYYGLIRGSRPARCLISFIQQARALRPPSGWARELPQFAPRVFPFVPPSVPRQTQRLPMTVPSPLALAFAIFAQARHLLLTHTGYRVSCVTRLQGSFHTAARRLVRPSPARAFTSELSPAGSPQRGVGYNYTAYSQFRDRTYTGKTRGPMGCEQRRQGRRGKLTTKTHREEPPIRQKLADWQALK